jgi:scyllo-inositol 2-dehydrogenase (NADP+)
VTVRVGILGTGWVATARHIPSYRRHPDAEVVAVYDRRPERAEQTAAAQGVARWFADQDEFLDQDLDIVSICTPPMNHAELAVAALRRGRHVLTEKPMAMDAAEAGAMADAAAAAGRLLCVSHNFLFSRAVSKAERFLAGADVGYAAGLQLSSLRRRLPTWYHELPGGLLHDECPHLLYTLGHFLGPLELDHARATRDPATGLPATAEILLRGPAGLGQMTMVFDTPVSEWHVGLVAPDRVVDLDLFRDIAMCVRSDRAHKAGDVLRSSLAGVGGHVAGFATSGGRYVTGRLFWGHDELVRRFVEATLGRAEVPVPVADSLAVVRLTADIVEALGRPAPSG